MSEIACPVYEAAVTSKNEAALINGDQVILYSEYDQLVRAAVAQMASAGLEVGERVAVVLHDSWQTAVILMALFRFGAVACPRNPRAGRARIREWIGRLGCRHAVIPGNAEFPDPPPGVRLWRDADWIGFPQAVEEGLPPRARVGMERLATVGYSPPRGAAGERAVAHTFGAHYYNARGANHHIRISSHCRWLATAPLTGMAGLSALFRCALSGAALVIPEQGEETRAAIERYQATHLDLLLPQIEQLLAGNLQDECMQRLRVVLINGGETIPEILKTALQSGLPLYNSYARDEMGSLIATIQPDSNPQQRLTSGAPLRHCEVRIAPDGQIMVRGQTLCQGYAGADTIRPVTNADGWFATGDTGRLGADGYLTVLKRNPAGS